MNIQAMEGSKGLGLDEVSHVLVPGRGRVEGNWLSWQSMARVETAVGLYDQQQYDGTMVFCGYKTPVDNEGDPFRPEGAQQEYSGVPEADSMYSYAQLLGSRARHSIERDSIDTVTNLVFAEQRGHFGESNHDPVAIVAQEGHLNRIIKDIAPKVLRRDYIGVVVDELPDHPDNDRLRSRVFGRAVLFGMHPEHPRLETIVPRRVEQGWAALLRVQRNVAIAKNVLGTNSAPTE